MKRLFALLLLSAGRLLAQDEAPPAKPWATSIGAGLAMTSGNRSTENLNFSFSTEFDPKAVHVFRAEALYIRGDVEGQRTVDKSAASARYERTIRDRAFAFTETSYLRDPFTNINYLVAPVAGAGYHLIRSEAMQLTVDGAFGATIQHDDERGRRENRAWKAGQSFEWNVSEVTRLTQKLTALVNGEDPDDALYQAEAALATAVVRQIELKVSYRYDHKTRPPLATLKRGDSALFVALVYKF